MGIRIHKTIGYGLDDLVSDKECRIEDSRINPGGILDNDADRDLFSLENYIKYLEEIGNDSETIIDLLVLKTADQKDWWKYDPLYSFSWNGEYGIPNVICFRPITDSDWLRYDDIIDWVEATHCEQPAQENKYKILKYGIYPWNGIYMDARTGRKLPQQATIVYGMLQTTAKLRIEHPEWDWSVTPELLLMGLKEIGFSSYEEASENIAPLVPDSIVQLLKWGKAFTDDSVIWQLRPMIYTYWS